MKYKKNLDYYISYIVAFIAIFLATEETHIYFRNPFSKVVYGEINKWIIIAFLGMWFVILRIDTRKRSLYEIEQRMEWQKRFISKEEEGTK